MLRMREIWSRFPHSENCPAPLLWRVRLRLWILFYILVTPGDRVCWLLQHEPQQVDAGQLRLQHYVGQKQVEG